MDGLKISSEDRGVIGHIGDRHVACGCGLNNISTKGLLKRGTHAIQLIHVLVHGNAGNSIGVLSIFHYLVRCAAKNLLNATGELLKVCISIKGLFANSNNCRSNGGD